MIQIFIIGSSTVYGVGGEDGGWADMVKRAFHQKMYASGGIGEKIEVFNFAKAGAEIKFFLETYPKLIDLYGRGGKIITIVSVGGNNIKAENRPDNFVSTLEEYVDQMSALFDMLKLHSHHVVAVGGGYYDESKTNPKDNPLTGGTSYFSNQRKQQFEKRLQDICLEKGVVFIRPEVSEEEWKHKYLFSDGLHPNNKGHQLIASKVVGEIEKMTNSTSA